MEHLKLTNAWSYPNPSAMHADMCLGLSRIFWVVLLITGSEDLAEKVLLDAINASSDPASMDDIFAGALKAAVRLEPAPFDDSAVGETALPPELYQVALLPPRLRSAFVLRYLVGRSKRECAVLMRLDEADADGLACAAAIELTRLRTAEISLHQG